MTDKRYKQYLEFLIAGNKDGCRKIVNDLLQAQLDIKDLYTLLFQKSMYEVGDLWESNKISIATEHLATTITQHLLALVYPIIFASEHIGKKSVITCGQDEFHQIGAKMVADIFELNGWDGYFLGANTPREALFDIITDKKPDIVGISISLDRNLTTLSETITTIQTHYPDQKIIVGGRAFANGDVTAIKKFKNVLYIPSIYELEKLLLTE